jgi:hypothetical protein
MARSATVQWRPRSTCTTWRTRGSLRRPREVGGDLFLRHAARGRAAVLGGVLRVRFHQGRARAQQMPR